MAKKLYTSTEIADELKTLAESSSDTDIARMVRHYTNEGLLAPVSAVHTGTGRKRLYPEDSLLWAAALLRLNRLGIPVGIMKDMVESLRRHLKVQHKGLDLLTACRSLDEPCLFIIIPDGKVRKKFDAKVLEKDAFEQSPEIVDVIAIQLARYTRS